MSSKRSTDEFKVEAVRQVTDRGSKVADGPDGWGGVTTHSLSLVAVILNILYYSDFV